MRTPLLAAVLALTGCAGGELTDALYPGNVPLDDEGRPTHLVVKVIDEETGAGIAGATVAFVDEARYPIPEAAPAPALTATADAEGWIRVPLDELHGRYSWLYFDAEGYGPRGENATTIDHAIRLRTGVNVPFEIRDELDRPVAGAQIDWHLGCGHTPAVQVVTTDADGRATLTSIDLDAGAGWIKAAGLHSDYLDLNWEPGQERAVIRVASAPVLRGRLLDHTGKPLAGAIVGEPFRHRGPWCATGPDGRYELIGLEWGESVQFARSPVHETNAQSSPSPLGHAHERRLPADGDDSAEWRPGRKVHIRTVRSEDGETIDGAQVIVVRKSDGETQWTFIQPEGQAMFGEPSTGDARFDLQPGEYELIVEHPKGLYVPLTVPLTVTGGIKDAPMIQELTLTHARVMKLEFAGVPPHATVWVAVPGRPSWDLTEEAHQAQIIPVPAEGPAVLRLSADDHQQYVVLKPGARTQTITWDGPPPVDPTKVDWEKAHSDDLPELPSSTLKVEVRAAGPVTVTVDGEPAPTRKLKGKADPIVVEHLEAGNREVIVAAAGCRAWRKVVFLTKGRTTTLSVDLPAAASK
jgi:hypothetical protein